MDPVIVTTLGLRVRRTKRLAEAAVVVALIPAQSEEDPIEDAVASLADQDSPPDLIIVCAGDCAGDMAGRAAAVGAFVFESVVNRETTAGALNEALAVLLPELGIEDTVLVMDPDSLLPWMFMSEASNRLRDGAGAVSTGAATLVSVPTLRHVTWARGEGLLPGDAPQVFGEEIGELPLALLHLGYKVVSPQGPGSRPLPAAAPVDLQGSPTPA